MSSVPKITRADETGIKGVDKVFAFVRERLLEGSLRSGDALIPERELAAQLNVSRPVLREALRALAAIGVVEIRDRIGTIVRRPDVSVLGDFFSFALAQGSDIIDDVMEARVAIECQAIRLACQRASISDFERIREALDRVEATIDHPVEGGRADFDFHAAIVRASKSETLMSLYQAMSALLLRSHLGRRELVQMQEGLKKYLLEDHRRILEAIVARDEQRADDVLRKHFEIGNEHRRQAAVGNASPAAA
ncbi:FadR/GntR family transcriptional regulator [Microvirga sp. 2TAF3]|uniref:FadR/GntR family transcriptional regulator n=1 Tax=Microvirga sp. 2TAF3 TaxID=3233014 RepID=UPI003F9E476E